MKRLPTRIYAQHRQLILYGLIGLSGAAIDLLLYILFYRALGIPPVIASLLSVSAGIVNNFIINSHLNFKVKDRLWLRFFNFYMIGVGGVLLSALLILVLFNGLGIDPTLAKIITIPPVVLLQFFLNRKFSFRDLQTPAATHPFKALHVIKPHLPFILIVTIFCLFSLLFIQKIPERGVLGGPDENAHYEFNVEYILDQRNLPVSGETDIAAYRSCRTNNFGQVPCLYSYVAYPGANYVGYALFAGVLPSILDIEPLTAARLLSMLWGVIFLFFSYLVALRITRNKPLSAALVATVGLIPQVIFSASYVNQDAHSLAIGAFATYAFTRFLQDPSRTSSLMAGLAFGGLLPLAKYNYFLLIPFVIIGLLFALYKHIINNKQFLRLIIYTVVSFVILAAFWYVRNIVLYNDPLGQGFVLHKMAEYHPLGVAHSMFSLETFKAYAVDNTFFNILFKSFFAVFGYMSTFLEEPVYHIIWLLLCSAIFTAFYIAFSLPKEKQKPALLAIACFLIFLLAALALVYYNSTTYDFQPQGRYLFPVLPASLITLAYLYKLHPRFKFTILLLLFTTLYAFIMGAELYIRNYL